MTCRQRRLRIAALAGVALFAAVPAHSRQGQVARLERELAAQQERILRLEALVTKQSEALERLTATPRIAASPLAGAAPAPMTSTAPAPAAVALAAAPASPAGDFRIPSLDGAGDVRVREEFNFSNADGRSRARSVLRARLRATYDITQHLAVGGQLATGDPDDPNSTDITLTGFDDDLDVSLDQAWIRYRNGGLTAYAGKFPNPFQRTDMVWDGDVFPEGVGLNYTLPLGKGGASLGARTIYFVVDEAPTGPDSNMFGVQGVLQAPVDSDIRLMLAGAFYGYRLRSIAGGDSGDFRSNLLVGGRYLSDFRLLNGLAAVTWTGLGPRWPLTVTGDYVRNLGAAVPSDSGFNIEFSAGKTVDRGDWRLLYNYSEVGVDAVFAAFSHDNIAIATNYRLHGLSLDYVPAKNVLLNTTLYHYCPLRSLYAGSNQPDDWLNRIRVNMMLSF